MEYSFYFIEPYYLHDGCEKGRSCSNGKACDAEAENRCSKGCSFAECLQIAREENADGFAFRSNLTDPTCSMCTTKQLEYLENVTGSGVYINQGK